MTDQIPLNYAVAKAQVGQLIESANGFNGLATVLNTVAISTKGSSTITLMTSRD